MPNDDLTIMRLATFTVGLIAGTVSSVIHPLIPTVTAIIAGILLIRMFLQRLETPSEKERKFWCPNCKDWEPCSCPFDGQVGS